MGGLGNFWGPKNYKKTIRSLFLEVLEGVQWEDVSALSVQGGRGVAVGQKGFLVYGETDNIVLDGLEFSSAVDLLSGDPVRVEPRTEGRVWVNSQQRTVWLRP